VRTRPRVAFGSCDLMQLPTANFAIRDWMELSKAAGVKILTTVAEAHAKSRAKRRVLVPTMGALHKAHGELIRVAREAAGKHGEVAVSIFVNPLQFEPGSDYEQYPRPEEADEEFCRNAGVDLLIRPSAE
jgi:pantoate--beta-alanine ligase